MEKSTQNTTPAEFIKDKFGLTEANLIARSGFLLPSEYYRTSDNRVVQISRLHNSDVLTFVGDEEIYLNVKQVDPRLLTTLFDDGYDIKVISKDITKITNIRTGDTMKLYANGDVVYLGDRGTLYYFRDKLKAHIVRPDNSEEELTVGNTRHNPEDVLKTKVIRSLNSLR